MRPVHQHIGHVRSGQVSVGPDQCQLSPLPSVNRAGFPQRLENLENKSGHVKVTERSWNIKKNGKKSWNFVLGHGILPIVSLNFTKFMPYY